MVLVDTSAWIRAFYGRQPYLTQIDQLLASEEVLAHEMVYGELLIGGAGARSKQLASYIKFPFAPTVAHREVVDLVRARKLYGRGIGWVDAHLLASSLVSGAELYTADGPLVELAAKLGVAYAPGA